MGDLAGAEMTSTLSITFGYLHIQNSSPEQTSHMHACLHPLVLAGSA
jgi:hypothetical protein